MSIFRICLVIAFAILSVAALPEDYPKASYPQGYQQSGYETTTGKYPAPSSYDTTTGKYPAYPQAYSPSGYETTTGKYCKSYSNNN
ncbi:hypothetical protein M8J75_002794 [Diaphorina citri]|nr:hypothetical protein M8J75_002794 [Diaphorina citri]